MASPAAPRKRPLVTGIGGVFFKARDPERLRAWYREHLGVEADRPGVNFFWREAVDGGRFGRTVWSAFPADTRYFGPGDQDFMINYRVRDLDELLARLRQEGIAQVGKTEEYWYGRFAWVVDGEGNRVELWEPDRFSPREFERRMKTMEEPR
jgi:catechol 2,3-dioxygenase-like lactoylglutathione lyase family enzyme